MFESPQILWTTCDGRRFFSKAANFPNMEKLIFVFRGTKISSRLQRNRRLASIFRKQTAAQNFGG